MGLLDTERPPWTGEIGYFATNPSVAGMMTKDQRVTLPPDTRLGRDSVKLNELLRLFLQDYSPKSSLSDLQKKQFKGTPYEADPQNALRSILARIGSGDPSAKATFEQNSEYRKQNQYGGLLGGLLWGGK